MSSEVRRRTRAPAGWSGLLLACVLGCTGQVKDALGTGASDAWGASGATGMTPGRPNDPGTAGTAADGGMVAHGPSTLLALPDGPEPSARLHKLTAVELTNSVHDLLGADAPLSKLEPDSVVAGFASVGASTVAISAAGVGLYEAALGTATQYAFADETHAASVLSCVPKSVSDTSCLRDALDDFGRRAFRRSLSSEERDRFVTLASELASESGGSLLIGLRHAVWAILQSPSFLYRVELGAPSPSDSGRLKYTSFELASRLAAALWNTLPDDALLDAAAADQLSTSDGVREQATRMLADARAHAAIKSFADELYGTRTLAEATKDPSLFPAWNDSLRAAMQEELERRVDDMVFTQRGDFLSLYDSRSSFVNDQLAEFYGLPKTNSSEFRAVELPVDSMRAGLLGAGAILSAFALPQRTSPTARGKFVNAAFLCTVIPPPPPNVPPLPAMPAPNTTLRERLTEHRSNPVCASCHSLMDPIGFGMERFDSVGQLRDKDNGQAIDATGSYQGASFDGLAQLGQVLRHTPVAAPCFVSKIYQNALGRLAVQADDASLDTLSHGFDASGHHVDELLLALVTSDAFRFVTPN